MAPRDDDLLDPFAPHSGAADRGRPLRSRSEARETRRPGPIAQRGPTLGSPGARRFVSIGAMLVVLLGLGGAYYMWQGMQQSTLQILNGLDAVLEVTIRPDAGDPIREIVLPRGRTEVRLAGPATVRVTARDGKLIAEDRIEVPRATDLVLYNILGAAAVQLEELIYHTGSLPPGVQPDNEVFWGQTFIARDDVQYIFEPPPMEAVVSDTSGYVSHWAVSYVADGSWLVTVNALLGPTLDGRPAPERRIQAQTIVAAMRDLDPQNVAARSFESLLLGGSGTPRPLAPLPISPK